MVAQVPSLSLSNGRFAWNGMPVKEARIEEEIGAMNPLLRGLLTLFAMMGIRLDLYNHKSYMVPAILLFVSFRLYENWFLSTTTITESNKVRLVQYQAVIFPFIYYTFLCTFPYWTFYLKRLVGDRFAVIAFNLGMGSLWMYIAVLFQLLHTFDPFTYLFDPVPKEAVLLVGGTLLVVGWVIKFWASYILGVAAYFYADMIHRKPLEGATFNMVGPYKWFRNPMYGVGYLGAYGYGVYFRSPLCLLLAAVMHAGVWVFNVAVEQVWVRRIYPDSPSATLSKKKN